MNVAEQAIILAAGRGAQADGMAKILIRHPATQKTIMDHAIEAFKGKRIIVVVGFRAIQVMEEYPALDYVINNDWAITHNAMSLGLALNDQPTYVVSGDMFLSQELIANLDNNAPNVALVEPRENRTLTAINCVVRDDNTISEAYQGPIRDNADPEAIGLFKVSDDQVLRAWKRLCVRHGNLFAAQTLPFDIAPIYAVPLENHVFDEINTPMDYQRLMLRFREQ
jgi:choline kinase